MDQILVPNSGICSRYYYHSLLLLLEFPEADFQFTCISCTAGSHISVVLAADLQFLSLERPFWKLWLVLLLFQVILLSFSDIDFNPSISLQELWGQEWKILFFYLHSYSRVECRVWPWVMNLRRVDHILGITIYMLHNNK